MVVTAATVVPVSTLQHLLLHHMAVAVEVLAVDAVFRLKERLARPENLEMMEHLAKPADQDKMDKTLHHHLLHRKWTGASNAHHRPQDLLADLDQRDQMDNLEELALTLMVANEAQEDR